MSGWLIALIQNQHFQSVPFLAHLLPVQPNLKRRGAAFATSTNVSAAPAWSISEQDCDGGGGNTSGVPAAFPAHLLLHIPQQLPLLSLELQWFSSTPQVAPDYGFPGQIVLMETQTVIQSKGFSAAPVTCSQPSSQLHVHLCFM